MARASLNATERHDRARGRREGSALELRQLEILIAVAEEGSVTRAARRLMMAQPSVTAQIRTLEAEIGYPLFNRLPRGMRPTQAGEVVISHARRIVHEVSGIADDIGELVGLSRGHLALGTVSTLTAHLIPTVVKTFHTAFPAVELRVVEGARSSELIEAVAGHRLDLAVVTSIERQPQASLTHLFDEELVAVVAADNPIGARSEIGLEELAGKPFLLPARGFGLHSIVMGACHKVGVAPAVALELGSMQAIKGLVEIDVGISILPRTTVAQEERLGLLRVVRLRPPRPTRPVQIAVPNDMHPSHAAQVFIDICQQQAASGMLGQVVTPKH